MLAKVLRKLGHLFPVSIQNYYYFLMVLGIRAKALNMQRQTWGMLRASSFLKLGNIPKAEIIS